MRLTKQTSYALRILIHCALRGDELAKAADIARAYNITEFNVLKIVPLLVQGGFVRSVRGRRGGLQLARLPSQIRIGDVVRLTEETYIQADCFGQLHEDCAIMAAAPVNRIFDSALRAFIDVLDQYTVQDLVSARPLVRRSSQGRLNAGLHPAPVD